LTRELRRAGAPPLHVGLQIRFRQGKTGGTSVHDTAERGPVTLAKTRDAENSSERIACHCR